jgi:hypothetical protein
MKDKTIITSAAIVYLKKRKVKWFIIKNSQEGEWELPKTNARRGESSVRASIRMMADQAGMTAKVLEEAGRGGGAIKVGNKSASQRIYYYLLIHESDAGEAIGFEDSKWLEYAKAVRTLGSKREQQMLREANKLMKKVEREKKKEEAAQKLLEELSKEESEG